MYRGLLRVARREGGIRIYAAHEHGPAPADAAERRARMDALVDVAVRIYAPLPARACRSSCAGCALRVPQWHGEVKGAIERAKQRLCACPHRWHRLVLAGRRRCRARLRLQDTVRLLTPFDPVVWDRDRFELLWGWVYRFEAYTPAAKRKLGYYALPLLWRDRVIGWGNLSVKNGELKRGIWLHRIAPPRDRAFKRELEAELDRVRAFLGLASQRS